MTELQKRMTAEDFSDWSVRMRVQRGWSDQECVRRLGCGVNQVAVWKREGAPRYIALACSALAFGLPPWRPPGKETEPQDVPLKAAE